MPNYLDDAHRVHIQALQQTFMARSDWPTWALLVGVYGGWFGLLSASPWLGNSLTLALLVPLVTLWMSLQHELLHGHPTRWPWLNKCLGYAPFAVWYPYTLYRDTHLQHHQQEHLTDPAHDPESRYFSQHQWQHSSPLVRGVLWLDKLAVVRLLLGPLLAVARLGADEIVRLLQRQAGAWRMWLSHALALALMFSVIEHLSSISIWQYLLFVSLPALSLSMIRSYHEHRPHAAPEQRTVINEAAWPWTWLFLNLNLHLVHHDLPSLPWYYLPRAYQARREQWLARSGGFLVQGYGQLFRRHGLQAIDSPCHPYL